MAKKFFCGARKIRWIFGTLLFLLLGLSLTMVTPVETRGGEWPTEAVRLIVPFSAGGLVDTFARGLQPYLSKELGVAVVVEGMPGAGTRIANEYIYALKPDGYTILVGNSSEMTVGEIVYDVDYKTEKFTYIDTYLMEQPAIVVKADSPYNTMKDLIEAAKKKRIIFGHIGTAGFYHLQTLLIEEATGVQFAKVPYKGGAPMGSHIQGGFIHAGIVGFGFGVKQQNAGNLKVIGVCGQTRHKIYSDIPCVKDIAPDFKGGSYVLGLLAPPGLPDKIRDKLEKAYQNAIKNKDFDKWAKKCAMYITSVGHEKYKNKTLDLKKDYIIFKDKLKALLK
jgi:tripartite-type tricarboxylate transporter receptor subunit TctC